MESCELAARIWLGPLAYHREVVTIQQGLSIVQVHVHMYLMHTHTCNCLQWVDILTTIMIVHTLITAQDLLIYAMISLAAQLKRMENKLYKLLSQASMGEGPAEGRTKDGQVCTENNLCIRWPMHRYIPPLYRLLVVRLVLLEMKKAVKEGHMMKMRYSVLCITSYDMCALPTISPLI